MFLTRAPDRQNLGSSHGRTWKLLREMTRRIIAALGALGVLMATVVAVATPAEASGFRSTYGTDFWVSFESNYVVPDAFIYLASATDANVTITWPDATTNDYTISGGSVTVVDATAKTYDAGKFNNSNDGIVDSGVHIVADTAITVYLLDYLEGSSGASIAIPTEYLGTKYWVSHATNALMDSYAATNLVDGRFSVTAVEAGTTTVTVTPSVSFSTRTAGTPYTVTLNQGQTYTAKAVDLIGTLLEGDQKIAVQSSVVCGNFGGACDQTVEYLPPVDTWGKDFVLVRSPNSVANPDKFIFLASQDNTVVTIDGVAQSAINAGEHFVFNGATSGNLFHLATSDKPILVKQVIPRGSFSILGGGSATGDGEEMVVSPTTQYLNDVIVSTPGAGFASNFIVVVAKTAEIGTITLDATAIPAQDFTTITGSDYSVAKINVATGSHRITSTTGFAAYVQGYNNDNSYAYTGGSGLVDLVANPGGVAEVGYRTQTQIASGDDPAPAAPAAPAPYTGPLLQEFSSRTLDVCTPKSITITGVRLSGVTASVQGKPVTVLENTATKLVLAFPAGLTPGQDVDLVINSSSGTLTHQDAFDIPADTCETELSKGRWTQLQSDGKTVKMYAKDPIGDGKIQFFVDGEEIAWVNAADEADPKLSFASSYPYLVRSVTLHEGKNRFEIKLDGVRVWRATYVPKGSQ